MKKASLLAIAALAALSAQAQTTEKSIGSDVRLLSKDIVLSDVSSSSASVKLKQKAEGKQLNVIVDVQQWRWHHINVGFKTLPLGYVRFVCVSK